MNLRTCGLATLSAVLLAAALSGCSTDDDRELTVLAAASLTDVFEELAVAFEEEHGVEVTFAFGSSTDLAGQAADGAPGDVLATADPVAMTVAADAGVVSDPVTFTANVLRIVTPPDDPGNVDGLADLTDTTWVRCVDPAPCGRVASAVLQDAGISAEPASLEEDVRAVLDKVVSGEANAGLVYASDARAAGEAVRTLRIAGAGEHATSYRVAVLEQAENAGLARDWRDLLTSEKGRAVLRDAGFVAP